jgi:nucleoside-diphosphate-sugar epimerase
MSKPSIIGPDDRILVTGAAGFIGSRVVANLRQRGFRNIVCLARQSGSAVDLSCESVEVVEGNLLSPQDCEAACKNAAVIYHLAAGTGGKSFPDAFMNSVVTTRNLLEASLRVAQLRRMVLVSSFTVYTNQQKGALLDEACPTEIRPELRGDAYCYAKTKQEELLKEYAAKHGVPYVIARPGSVYGAGKDQITGRVGLGTFGMFVHLGGSNTIPFTHVDNCADAIVLAGLVPGIEGEVFNLVDDDLPSSREFLRSYKKHVKSFKSLYIPHSVSYGLCYLWEKYSEWSQGQLPPVFNRRRWHADWRSMGYSNRKLKTQLGWSPTITTTEGLRQYFQSCRQGELSA